MTRWRLVLLGCLALATAAAAQQVHQLPDCYSPFQSESGGQIVTLDNRMSGCTNWTLVYASSGFSAVSIELDGAPDTGGQPGSFSLWPSGQVQGGATLPLTATDEGEVSVTGFLPWVEVKATVTGAGTLSGALIGFRPLAQAAVPASVSVSSLPALAAGANLIGSVNALQSGSWNMDVRDGSGNAIGSLGNTALNVVAGGADSGNNFSYLRVDAWNADGQAATLKGPITWSRLSAGNGSTWDNLRTGSADGGGKMGQLEVTRAWNGTEVASATTTAIKATAGILHRLVINTPVSGATVKLYNVAGGACTGTPGSGAMGVITLPATAGNPVTLDYDETFSAGICVVTSAATDVSVIWE